jgi:hypothetical protein
MPLCKEGVGQVHAETADEVFLIKIATCSVLVSLPKRLLDGARAPITQKTRVTVSALRP